MSVPPLLPELDEFSEAEELFEALGVPYDPAVLAAHRLHVLKAFSLCVADWVAAHPDADGAERRAAVASALRQAHDVFAEEEPAPRCNPFAPGLVKLGRPR